MRPLIRRLKVCLFQILQNHISLWISHHSPFGCHASTISLVFHRIHQLYLVFVCLANVNSKFDCLNFFLINFPLFVSYLNCLLIYSHMTRVCDVPSVNFFYRPKYAVRSLSRIFHTRIFFTIYVKFCHCLQHTFHNPHRDFVVGWKPALDWTIEHAQHTHFDPTRVCLSPLKTNFGVHFSLFVLYIRLLNHSIAHDLSLS